MGYCHRHIKQKAEYSAGDACWLFQTITPSHLQENNFTTGFSEIILTWRSLHHNSDCDMLKVYVHVHLYLSLNHHLIYIIMLRITGGKGGLGLVHKKRENCLYTYISGKKNPEDGEMNEMTLSSRHRIRNSSPGGLNPNTPPLGHGGSPQY